jgi:hypothetical protein
MRKGIWDNSENYKPYRFTLLEDRDREIIEFLDSIPKPIRG